jgi:hypothetical protein
MMNVIVVYDVYCVAVEGESAELAVLEAIKSGEISASQHKALPMVASPVRPAWRDERPLVADDVPDAIYEQLRGKTTQQAYEFLTKKQP